MHCLVFTCMQLISSVIYCVNQWIVLKKYCFIEIEILLYYSQNIEYVRRTFRRTVFEFVR